MPQIDPLVAQDAYHYAMAANGGTWGGHESAFCSDIRDKRTGYTRGMTRTQYLRQAYSEAKLAGLDVQRPLRLSDARLLCAEIHDQCLDNDIDPSSGLSLEQALKDSSVAKVMPYRREDLISMRFRPEAVDTALAKENHAHT